ncbi:DEAD/DEAH box helicase family protein [Vibrio parahaemolyticus]|uniref:DEAD/DEAH box helicase family protein n=1 Tax=Vibrio parahaemolyticus TaxID=670 RepID=A0A9Q3UG66_VIBPH|nr:DEAD/DEAH box helicase family protein [Vibrio parahaemolyticus]EGQ8549565.1 type III restriction endonuclease subunit R [Vibrio parahaemolyticus]EGQ9074343.1 type III restriction endonuclease subunit R [Vibrio parahaemolyticus]EGQ9131133.1 type III restriction endonuclease subunit R [Vibrio parahaemolyticus]EHA6961555.1 DEAD/DEAH box helicase family protein [Vibrio parahaemolyticus]EHA6975983.1 DEAD/DEAH box helicase family protein [Vibrio parahaemolyticus]
MKFTLKDYQREAVHDSLNNLSKAKKRWHEDDDIHAFSLTATTGAGKTVMAAAAFEALFYGDDEFDFEADPGAVVIWFSDDPSLNEQTRFRLMEAADKLNHTDLVVVENTFSLEKFEAGKVYFLNTQKLSKNSLLVRGYDPDGREGAQSDLFPDTRPDLRSHTIWEVIRNTIEDPSLTLYLVLDEAHRGMGAKSKAAQNDKSTIVKRLINGAGSVPAIPVVWGISATVERFNQAMSVAQGRSTLPNVEVDPSKVQESGLLKDTIILDVPDEAGLFDTVLVRRATEKIVESSRAWSDYTVSEGLEPMLPLMILQVPNKPKDEDISRALDTIFEHWPDLKSVNIAHVFGERKTLNFGRHTVYYTSPERVQDDTEIRVLIAKDAISTGWDCPRAEVMISFRPANDETHITQLLGRMVRTPLARRIPGNDRLNAVDCILPFFNKKSVESIANSLMHGSFNDGETEIKGRRVLINPVTVEPNKVVSQDIWSIFSEIPSQVLPQKIAKPIKRLTALAHELAQDGLVSNAGKIAHSEMHKVLNAAFARYSVEIEAARKDVLTVDGKSLRADLSGKSMSFDDFVEEADYAVIEDAYKRAARIFSPDIARTYAEHLADDNQSTDSREDALLEAYIDIAALGLVKDVSDYLNSEAEKMSNDWFNKYRVQIKNLTDVRQESYRQIREMSKDPQNVDLVIPKSWMEPTILIENGKEELLPTFPNHLMSQEDGLYPALLNEWESKVIEVECSRDGFEAWYRNPARSSQDSLGISYVDNGEYKLLRPDFIFFARKPDGDIAVDIVDPHSLHLSDALPKLKGLAVYAEQHGDKYRRIESVAAVGSMLMVLDLMEPIVRKRVQEADNAKVLFTSEIAEKYSAL